jgi:hypothetical protein
MNVTPNEPHALPFVGHFHDGVQLSVDTCVERKQNKNHYSYPNHLISLHSGEITRTTNGINGSSTEILDVSSTPPPIERFRE